MSKTSRSSSQLSLDISRLLTTSQSSFAAIEKAARLLAKYTEAEGVQINALDSDGERVIEIFSLGSLTSLFPAGLRRPSHGTSVRTIISRGPMVLDESDLHRIGQQGIEDFAVYKAVGYNHLAATPISLHSNDLGAIQLLSADPLCEDALEKLTKAVHQLAPYVALHLSGIEDAEESRIALSIERVAESVIRDSGIVGVAGAVVNFARSSMGIDSAILRVMNAATGRLEIEYTHGHLDPADVAGEAFGVVEDYLIPNAVKHGGPIIVDDGSPMVFHHAPSLALLEEIPSLMVIPLLEQDELVGTLEFYSLNEYAYRSDHLRSVEHVANLLTSAVEHFRLIRSLSREAEIRKFLAEVSRIAGAADDVGKLFDSISPELSRVIPVDRITYYIPPERFDFNTTVVAEGSGREEGGRSRFNGRDAGFLDSAAGLVRIAPYGPEYTVCVGPSDDRKKSTCRAANCVAAKLWDDMEGRPDGWIHLERSESPFTIEEIDLVPEFARHISPAIDTALSHEAELHLAQEQLRAEQAEAEAKHQRGLNEAKEAFIATMSHELRTPLTSIRAFTDLLARDEENLTAKQTRQIAVVRRNTEWLNILINDLLDLSSMDSGRFELQFREVDLTRHLRDLGESFGPIAEAAGHDLRVILPNRAVNVTVDPDRINQVVGNLLNNAMKYSPDGTPIRLLARPVQAGVHIYVRDEGLGIPPKQIKRVFERFVRARSKASGRARGTGIGLYVSRMIAEGHGGTISATSTVDSHTTMHVWLPSSPAAHNLSVTADDSSTDAA